MKIISLLILFISTCLLFNSCDQSIEPRYSSYNPVLAPAQELPVKEIMKSEGITSIHYNEYDSLIVYGIPRELRPLNEYYIDTLKFVKIELVTSDTTVYDLVYFPLSYQQEVQKALGSWLKNPIKYLGAERLDEELCYSFTDITGYQEWVWDKNRVPVLRRLLRHNNDGDAVTILIKRDIILNQNF